MPSKSTIVEWIRCLASPEYAKTTHLRITEEEERRALSIANVIIVVLTVLCLRQGIILADRVYTLYKVNQYNKTHPIKSTEFKII